MGERQEKLNKLVKAYWPPYKHEKPTQIELVNSRYSTAIKETYNKLSGLTNEPPARFGSWDISTTNFIVELDEERHFNKYRLTTLQSDFYINETPFSITDYKEYCLKNESHCLKAAGWGKSWSNDSTEKQFGLSNGKGNLSGNGSSRWKQRAFYDFLKDVSSKIIDVPVIRISIYDKYKGMSVEQLLKGEQHILLLQMLEDKLKRINKKI